MYNFYKILVVCFPGGKDATNIFNCYTSRFFIFFNPTSPALIYSIWGQTYNFPKICPAAYFVICPSWFRPNLKARSLAWPRLRTTSTNFHCHLFWRGRYPALALRLARVLSFNQGCVSSFAVLVLRFFVFSPRKEHTHPWLIFPDKSADVRLPHNRVVLDMPSLQWLLQVAE